MRKIIGFSLVVCFWAFILTTYAGAAPVYINSIYVEPNGICGGNTPCYSTIQAGIDNAADSTIVKIAQGTYHENISLVSYWVGYGKYLITDVLVQGGWSTDFSFRNTDPSLTVVNGDTTGDGIGDGSVFHIDASEIDINDIDITIEGLTLTNGDSSRHGGGISVEAFSSYDYVTVTLINNIITGNTAYWCGGGVSALSAQTRLSLILSDNIISNNKITKSPFWTDYGGGGLCADAFWGVISLNVQDNTITDNSAGASGGGILLHCQECEMSGNIMNNKILNNRAANGGGIALDYSEGSDMPLLILENNIIADNTAEFYGGGMDFYFGDFTFGLVSMINNTVSGNTAADGGGIYAETYAGLANLEITSLNSLIWGNMASNIGDDLYIKEDDTSSYCPGCISTIINASYSDIGDIYIDPVYPGTYNDDGTNINIDPVFVDPLHVNYHLSASSPLIESGTNNGAPQDDLEGNPRPIDGNYDGIAVADIGAYEFVPAKKISILLNIDPDKLNTKSNGKWIIASIMTPDKYNVRDIRIDTVKLETIPAVQGEVQSRLLIVKFDRQRLIGYLMSTGRISGDVILTMSGKLVDGTLIEGRDQITITK